MNLTTNTNLKASNLSIASTMATKVAVFKSNFMLTFVPTVIEPIDFVIFVSS